MHPPTKPLPQTPLGRFRHYKGGEYEVLHHARHSETEEELVVYRQIDKDTGWWVRPRAMFFEEVTVDGVTRPRFRLVTGPEEINPEVRSRPSRHF
jgi:hypothetical protein